MRLLVINHIVIITRWLLDRRRCHESKKSPFWLLLMLLFLCLLLKHSLLEIHWLAHAEHETWLLLVLEDDALLLLHWHFLLEQLLLPLAKELLQLVLRLAGLNAGHVEGGIVIIAATCYVEIDLGFSRPFQITAKRIVLNASFGDTPMECLLHEMLAAFALLFPSHQPCLLAEGIAAACKASSGVSNEWIVVRGRLSTLVTKAWSGPRLLWVLPDFTEGVRFDPEEAPLISHQLALLLQPANGEQEVSVVDCVLLLTVVVEQVVPDVTAQATLIIL